MLLLIWLQPTLYFHAKIVILLFVATGMQPLLQISV